MSINIYDSATSSYVEGVAKIYQDGAWVDTQGYKHDGSEWKEVFGSTPLKTWLKLGGIVQSFSTLAEVFESEIAVRRLMTIHASSDYLVEWSQKDSSIIDTFCANDTAMKWIGLRDYICDKLMAIDEWKSKLLSSEYWERILKDHVPVMTSNTAPYGKVIYNNQNSSYPIWQAFDNNDNTPSSHATEVTSGHYTGYKFTNPIRINKVYLHNGNNDTNTLQLQGSNDGTAWTNIDNAFTISNLAKSTYNIINENYYLYYRLYLVSSSKSTNFNCMTLQFYGRSLNVSVPTMTSNTAPWGEVSASSVYDSSHDCYKVFVSGSSGWCTSSTNTAKWIQYTFDKPKNHVKSIILTNRNLDYYYSGQVDVIADYGLDTQTTISSYTTSTANNNKIITLDVDVDIKNIRITAHTTSGSYFGINALNFFGVDYSEREFEEGSTMKYIYDHGVELESVTKTSTSALSTISTTDYDLLRATVGSHITTSNTLKCGSGSAVVNNLPNNCYLNISNINGSNSTGFSSIDTNYLNENEWWLE